LPDIPASLTHNADGAAFSRQGELFIGNDYGLNGNGDISRFTRDSDGNFIPNGVITGNSLSEVHGLAFSANGELFAANYRNGLISRFLFDSTGGAIANGTINTGMGPHNQGLAFSSSGELFITHASNVIQRFAFDPSTGAAIPKGSFTVPGAIILHGIAFSPRGELFVADPSTDKVFRFLFDGDSNPVTNGSISLPYYTGPLGVAFSPEGELFVTGHFTGGIHRFLFDADGNAVANGVEVTDHLGYVAISPLLPPIITVAIDIKPGSPQNTINLGASGVIPVAILSSSTFNAPKEVNPDTLTLAGSKVRVAGKSGKFLCSSQDVNGDGLEDLVCQFENELNAQTGDSMAVLEGETYSGVSIRGQDSITIVP
jgi:WD40 repeat protein